MHTWWESGPLPLHHDTYFSGRSPNIAPLYCKAIFTASGRENSTNTNLKSNKQTDSYEAIGHKDRQQGQYNYKFLRCYARQSKLGVNIRWAKNWGTQYVMYINREGCTHTTRISFFFKLRFCSGVLKQSNVPSKVRYHC